MWNSLELKCPEEDLCEYPPQDRYIVEELQNFVSVLTAAADILTSENPLWSEMDVLRNLQVKYKRILHCDKFLIFLHRVGHCLKKMVLLNLSKSYLDLAERFLIGLQDLSATFHLPSRQQVEYILIRTLTASKLVCDATKYSRETFCFLIQKLRVGHLILDLVMAASVTARLNVFLQAVLEQLSSMYQQVLSWRYKVKSGSFQWTEKLNLPQDMKDWLKSFGPAYLKPLPMSRADIDSLSSLLNPKNGNIESDSESVVMVNEIVKNNNDTDASVSRMDDSDYGEVIPRQEAKTNQNLTHLQESTLQKIVQVRSLRDLEHLWNEINSFSNDHFPKILTQRKKEVISKLLTQIRKTVSSKKFNKSFRKEPKFLKDTLTLFCKHLGFSREQVKLLRNATSDSNGTTDTCSHLVPVKTVKELRLLYKQLCAILQFTDETEKLRKLKKLFKHRISAIKALKLEGEKATARKLTFCTSKEFLTLCQ